LRAAAPLACPPARAKTSTVTADALRAVRVIG
jgi:hypothetical protein